MIILKDMVVERVRGRFSGICPINRGYGLLVEQTLIYQKYITSNNRLLIEIHCLQLLEGREVDSLREYWDQHFVSFEKDPTNKRFVYKRLH